MAFSGEPRADLRQEVQSNRPPLLIASERWACSDLLQRYCVGTRRPNVEPLKFGRGSSKHWPSLDYKLDFAVARPDDR